VECGVTETAALVEPPQSGSCAEAGVLEQFSHTKVEVRTLKCNRQRGGSNGLRIDVTGLYDWSALAASVIESHLSTI
jgi:hypothetical protein